MRLIEQCAHHCHKVFIIQCAKRFNSAIAILNNRLSNKKSAYRGRSIRKTPAAFDVFFSSQVDDVSDARGLAPEVVAAVASGSTAACWWLEPEPVLTGCCTRGPTDRGWALRCPNSLLDRVPDFLGAEAIPAFASICCFSRSRCARVSSGRERGGDMASMSASDGDRCSRGGTVSGSRSASSCAGSISDRAPCTL